jgi:D-alanyl-D-alanine carboxypeptidase
VERLHNVQFGLEAAIRDAERFGVVAASVIMRPEAAPQTIWRPPGNAEPLFLAYSITKLYTAAIVFRLCEEGRLSLEDRVSRWFASIDAAQHITIRQLLNHTSGIADYGGSDAYHSAVRSFPSDPWTFERFAEETVDRGLLFEPGTGWAYSNPGFMLLKRIVEEEGNGSYADLVERLVVRRLGLEHTFAAQSLSDLASLAPGTSTLLTPDGSKRDVRTLYHPGWVSHGVIAATASDVARFLDSLFQGGLLNEKSLAQMLDLVPVNSPDDLTRERSGSLRALEPSYGLGVMGDPESPWGLTVGHTGGGPCYSISAFHSFGLGGVSVCMAAAIESFDTQAGVAAVFDSIDATRQ